MDQALKILSLIIGLNSRRVILSFLFICSQTRRFVFYAVKKSHHFVYPPFKYTASTKVTNVYREDLVNTREEHLEKLCGMYILIPLPSQSRNHNHNNASSDPNSGDWSSSATQKVIQEYARQPPGVCVQRFGFLIGSVRANLLFCEMSASMSQNNLEQNLPYSPTIDCNSPTRHLTFQSTDADFDLPWNASIPSRIGLQASLPPFRVLNFQWKISLHLSNNSFSVNSTNFWNCRRSAIGSCRRCWICPSQKYQAAPKILSVTRIIMRKTLNAVAHSLSLLMLLLVDHIIFPQSFSTFMIRLSCKK